MLNLVGVLCLADHAPVLQLNSGSRRKYGSTEVNHQSLGGECWAANKRRPSPRVTLQLKRVTMVLFIALLGGLVCSCKCMLRLQMHAYSGPAEPRAGLVLAC